MYPSTSHFEDRQKDSIINCIIVPLSVFRLEGFFFNLEKEVSPGRLEVAVVMFSLSKSIILYYFRRVGLWYAHSKWDVSFRLDVVGVDREGFCSMIGCIEEFEHLPSYKFIVTINYCQNLARAAVIIDCLVDISHMVLSLYVFHKRHSLFYIRVLLNLFLNFVCSVVLWGIVYNYNMVILVILLHDCVDIHKISKFVGIFVCGHNHTKLKLGIGTYVVFYLICLLLWGYCSCYSVGIVEN